jgi:GrpB-like predicted nucleotidyltransferase (UPF0157 family)/chloramphenicol 3-O-phosphotransferase
VSRATDTTEAAEKPVIYLISGPISAGKSTVARLLAARFAGGVHLERDADRLALAEADAYFEAGFSVVLDDVVDPAALGDARAMIRSRPCHVIVLLPSLEAVVARDAGRERKGHGAWTVPQSHKRFVDAPTRVGIWLDTSDLTPEATVDAILEQTPDHPTSSHSPIVVSDYDDEWPTLFEQLASPIRDAVADLNAPVKHVGSTAVPGLRAKPIIDIDVVVTSARDVPVAIARLCSLGYIYQGDKGIPGREAFMWPRGARPHHVYVVVAGGQPYRDHIEFRDYLREQPEVARQYGELKARLAEEYGNDRVGYTDAKTAFVTGVLRAAEPGRTRRPDGCSNRRLSEPGG